MVVLPSLGKSAAQTVPLSHTNLSWHGLLILLGDSSNIFEVIRGDVIQKPSDLCSGLGITKTFITYPVKLVVENPIPLNIESPYLITITSEVRSFERTGFVKGHNCLQFKQDSNKNH